MLRDDPIALLERELLEAARRQVVADEREGSSQEPRGPWTVAPRPARRRRSLGGFAAVVLSGLALVVAFGALVSLRGRKAEPSPRRAPAAASSSRQQLIDILGVLRRPQTRADLPAGIRSELTGPSRFFGTPDLSLVRYATTTPWGEKLYLVPMKPLTAGQLEHFARQQHLPLRRVAAMGLHGESLSVFSSGGGGGGANAAEVEAGREVGTEGGGGLRGTRVTLVVPDGVATVRFVFRRQPNPEQYGAPTYPHSLTVSVPVRGNVAAVQVDRSVSAAGVPMVWYAADGHVIKRIGNLADANRVVPTPQPGPETALSRAAERDPSTPNRVWVTPSTGRPHTNFMVHFRVLLNGAGYNYRLSGPSCPAITVNGGDGGGTNDLRGRIWSSQVAAVAGQAWCPGTYHVSVQIMGRRPARPFGSTTFIVKR